MSFCQPLEVFLITRPTAKEPTSYVARQMLGFAAVSRASFREAIHLAKRLGDTVRDLAGQPDRTEGNSSTLQFGLFGPYLQEAKLDAAVYEIG